MTAPRAIYSSFGFFGRRCGHPLPGAWFTAALPAAGLEVQAVRQALHRMERAGELEATRVGRDKLYQPTAIAWAAIDAGRDKMFARPARAWDGAWTVVCLRLAARDRTLRDRVATLLHTEGFARLLPGVHAHPRRRGDRLLAGLRAEGAGDRALVFTARLADEDETTRMAARWDLGAVAAGYRRFLRRHARTATGVRDPAGAFRLRLEVVCDYLTAAWRDPELPRELLPRNWPGEAARALARSANTSLTPLALRFAAGALASALRSSPGLRRALVVLLLACAAACGNRSAVTTSAPAGDRVLAVRGATVLPMDGSPEIERATVLVVGDRIAEVGADSDVAVPPGATVLDGRGRFVMPGLADMHVHLRDASESVLADYLREGVTTVRDMNGRPGLLAWRDRIRTGTLVGPTLVVASPTLGNWSSPEEGYPTPETPVAAAAAVERFADQGYDLIKVYTFLPPELLAPIVEAARVHRLPVAGHVPKDLGLQRALAAGLSGVEHLTGYVDAAMTDAARAQHAADLRGVFGAGALDPARLERAVTLTVAAGAWNCPTLVFFDRIQPTPMVKEAWSQRALVREGSRNRRDILRRLAAAGGRIVVGTDSDGGEDLPARAIHDELEAMEEAGMAPEAVLRAATAGAAEMLGRRGELGTVTARGRADLLILPCDPRRRLACVRAREVVIAGGVVVARER